MAPVSGLATAGRILLLVGAIMSLLGACFLLGLITLLQLLGERAPPANGTGQELQVMGLVYGILALVLVVGAVFGYLAYRFASRGQWRQAWTYGFVAALVPPLQLIPLLGAIFCLVSPEGEQARNAPKASP
jgi:MFS family permease